MVGSIYYRKQVSYLKLSASRAFWLVAYPSQGNQTLFDASTRSFAALGAVARRGIYDIVCAAFDMVQRGKAAPSTRASRSCAHHLYDPTSAMSLRGGRWGAKLGIAATDECQYFRKTGSERSATMILHSLPDTASHIFIAWALAPSRLAALGVPPPLWAAAAATH